MKFVNIKLDTLTGLTARGTCTIITGWWFWKVARHNVSIYTLNGGQTWRCHADQKVIPLALKLAPSYDASNK